ncbi:succinylglutamate-semialdehyde dehydrogenase [Capnocytophaga genosp. AHN8471]|uniref:succinylglutamate-semialdehyde dehydrogenase n=1 Tax=Capnocytophaga genosp. AHN8471 TaxID=327574 RepID=UPI0019345D5B|nr:succinylglutamate-semialdehyde dehydrogenase [Capnocytophaga genosp. AHN8471]MBM0655930.1 succinylglutamate-semialdehyde dehydrogenase [Capnocytophaga genosp. AHN8471]MBM0659698.1 succinylglutamate-semialdehyde dehydrogenase [Capnocytophaga genosp. AHN8471]
MNITLPPYTTTEDLQKCMVIVREILDSKAITINDEQCQAIALEVMGISYAKGGDYSPEIIKSFTESYLKTSKYKE